MSVAFYNRLFDQLRTTGVAKSTAENYVAKIKRLIGTPRRLKDLSQLKDTETILESISHLSLGTRGNYLSAILAVLRLAGETGGYQEAIKTYETAMGELKAERSGIDTSDMTPTQEKNWVEWSEVLEKHKALEEDYQAIKSKAKRRSPSDFRKIQDYVVLSLYTKIPPRRNRDYLDVMFVADKDSRPKTGDDCNYYFQKDGVFQFNVYKTAKHYGSQEIKVPDELKEILDYYASVIPSKVKWLICSPDGQPQRASTAMTRILNRIMGKNVGSSMLRHIYLTNKYDISEMTKDSQMMGHSLSEQREYLKKRPDGDQSSPEAKTETDTKTGGSRLDNLRVFTDERLVLPSV